jgi:hypothetical protein
MGFNHVMHSQWSAALNAKAAMIGLGSGDRRPGQPILQGLVHLHVNVIRRPTCPN